MSERAAELETGFAVVAPLLWLAAGELVGPILQEVFESEPTDGDEALNFTLGGGGGCGDWVEADAERTRAIGTVGGVAVEYAEAFARLDAMVELARRCANDQLGALELSELRKGMARALNAGIFEMTDFQGHRIYRCERSERPTRGQVRAWLGALAGKLGVLCSSAELAQAQAEVSKPLEVAAAKRAAGGVVGLSPLGWAAIAAAVGGAVLLWRQAA